MNTENSQNPALRDNIENLSHELESVQTHLEQLAYEVELLYVAAADNNGGSLTHMVALANLFRSKHYLISVIQQFDLAIDRLDSRSII